MDYTRAGGILPWWRRVAASLKFHTRWPTYRNPYYPQTCLASSPAVKHPENFLPEESTHYTSCPSPAVCPPTANVPSDNFGKPFTGEHTLLLAITCDWILHDLHESSNGRIVSRDWWRERLFDGVNWKNSFIPRRCGFPFGYFLRTVFILFGTFASLVC